MVVDSATKCQDYVYGKWEKWQHKNKIWDMKIRQIWNKLLLYYEILRHMKMQVQYRNKNNENAFAVISNLQNNYRLKLDFQKVNQQTVAPFTNMD